MEQWANEIERVITAKIDEDFARAAAEPSLGAATARFGRTTVTRLAALPHHPAYNKARGFNEDDAGQLDSVRAFFSEAGLRPLIEVWAGDASAALGRRLARAGFYAAEVNATLRAEPLSTPGLSPSVEVREVTAEDDSGYLATLFAGYQLTAEAESAQRTMMDIEHRSPRLRRYVAYVDGEPAAAAALYTNGQRSYFAGAATIPGMRNRGCQSALIQRRLDDAATTSEEVVVTTAFGSPSQANLQRLGFASVHTRALWRPLPED
jgi:predicted GNAT family acetyltransferase